MWCLQEGEWCRGEIAWTVPQRSRLVKINGFSDRFLFVIFPFSLCCDEVWGRLKKLDSLSPKYRGWCCNFRVFSQTGWFMVAAFSPWTSAACLQVCSVFHNLSFSPLRPSPKLSCLVCARFLLSPGSSCACVKILVLHRLILHCDKWTNRSNAEALAAVVLYGSWVLQLGSRGARTKEHGTSICSPTSQSLSQFHRFANGNKVF